MNDKWSYTFTQSGTYRFYDYATYATGEIVVLP
jgi:hypothetical protein